ncbi:SRA stem-loop-interacting RNA-binding protein, mitochondrial isoform X1 [Anomalospiza imberbis]|uniref:SRA stem-loop-interacting RNA-binding protein, mitochondrial isoform X1 n=1 Tax=Anomalospiza imberbis TaxID=187417 RepID=UPI00358E065E
MAAASAVRVTGNRSRRLFNIFVAEIPWTVSSKELKEYFSQFGLVQRCQLPFDRDTGFHRRYCWIKFSTAEEVQNVLQKDSHILEGSKLTLTVLAVKSKSNSFVFSSSKPYTQYWVTKPICSPLLPGSNITLVPVSAGRAHHSFVFFLSVLLQSTCKQLGSHFCPFFSGYTFSPLCSKD